MFDRYVEDKKRRRPLLYAAFVGSSILEAGAIIGLIVYSFIHVDEVQPPPLTVQFIASTPPPPPPPPPPKAANKPKTPPKVVKPVTQPIAVPTTIQQPKEPEPPEEKDTGGSEGVAGGVEGGVAGGVVGSAPAPPPPKEEPKPPPKPKVVPAILIKKDKISSGDDPHLPDVVKAQRRGSVVTGSYKVCISRDGSIGSVDVINSIPGADESITSTLRGWRYKPQNIPICFIQFLEFHIE